MNEKQRYYLELAYDGTNYNGWQIQPNAPSVQSKIEEALSILLKEEVAVTGAGRTDTGVHARFYVLHFDSTHNNLDEQDTFIYKLNGILPNDIAVYHIFKVHNSFHARFDAISRTYKYFIHLRKEPFNNLYSAFIAPKPDLDLMTRAADIIRNTNDFESFCKAHSGTKTYICKIHSVKWQQTSENKLVFTISADRFLRNMVRAITGTIIEVGQGKLTLEEFQEIIEKRDRSAAGYSVPAKGLFLTKILYNCNVFVK